jgi:hypothetical protein
MANEAPGFPETELDSIHELGDAKRLGPEERRADDADEAPRPRKPTDRETSEKQDDAEGHRDNALDRIVATAFGPDVMKIVEAPPGRSVPERSPILCDRSHGSVSL